MRKIEGDSIEQNTKSRGGGDEQRKGQGTRSGAVEEEGHDRRKVRRYMGRREECRARVKETRGEWGSG